MNAVVLAARANGLRNRTKRVLTVSTQKDLTVTTTTINRFYKAVSVEPDGGAFGVRLDGRAVKTPQGFTLHAPTRDAAQLLADEWDAQGATVNPETMPITRLINVALDHMPAARDESADTLAKYAETDVVCHLADTDETLQARQEESWAPLRVWAEEALGVHLLPAQGILAVDQPADSLARMRDLALTMDDVRLTATLHAAGVLHSAVLALALERGRLNAIDAFAASRIDEIYQEEHWGQDDEAAKRAAGLLDELVAVEKLLRALAP